MTIVLPDSDRLMDIPSDTLIASTIIFNYGQIIILFIVLSLALLICHRRSLKSLCCIASVYGPLREKKVRQKPDKVLLWPASLCKIFHAESWVEADSLVIHHHRLFFLDSLHFNCHIE